MRALALVLTIAVAVPCRIAAADLASPTPSAARVPRVVVVRGVPGGEETLLALYRDGLLLVDDAPGRVPVEQYRAEHLSPEGAERLVSSLRGMTPRRRPRRDDNRYCVIAFATGEPSRRCGLFGWEDPLPTLLSGLGDKPGRETPFMPESVLVHLRPYDARCAPRLGQKVAWPAVWPLPPGLATRGEGDVTLPGAAIPVLGRIGTHPPDPCAWAIEIGERRFLHGTEVRLPADALWRDH